MTRYFYKCPLSAAYMAKHFSITFVNSERDIHEDCQRELEMMWGKTIHSGELEFKRGQIYEKYIVHPDCKKILQPMVGDLVKDSDGECQYVWEDHKGLGVTTSRGTESPQGCPIIQRNNLPFITPDKK